MVSVLEPAHRANMPKVKMKSFKEWKLDALDEHFHLTRALDGFECLTELLTVPELADKSVQTQLSALSNELRVEQDNWNEEELKLFFISGLLKMVHFRGKQYRLFYDRHQHAAMGEIELNGIVDAVVASGNQDPKQPFFFLHEYKPETQRSSNDPKGQLLSAMLAAQIQNKDKNLPIYGCYVLGRFWFFTVLKGKTYSFSGAYDATKQEDIQAVYQILQKIKGKIEGYLVQKFGIA